MIMTPNMCLMMREVVRKNWRSGNVNLWPKEFKIACVFWNNCWKTMTDPKVSWRKPPRPEKGDAICTRLILSAANSAVKKYGFQRGSERTICPSKWPNRTVREGHNLPYLQFQHTPLPGSQTIPACLPNSMVIVIPAHTPAVIISYAKRGCAS